MILVNIKCIIINKIVNTVLNQYTKGNSMCIHIIAKSGEKHEKNR